MAIGYAAWLNGMTGLAITKLDVLDTFEAIKICIGYKLPNGSIVTDSMPDTPVLMHVTPVYEVWEGWKTSTSDCRRWDDLPKAARVSAPHQRTGRHQDRLCVGRAGAGSDVRSVMQRRLPPVNRRRGDFPA